MSFINLFEMCIESNKKLVSVLVHRLQSNGNLVHGITMSIFINVKFNIIYIYRNTDYIYIREKEREKNEIIIVFHRTIYLYTVHTIYIEQEWTRQNKKKDKHTQIEKEIMWI